MWTLRLGFWGMSVDAIPSHSNLASNRSVLLFLVCNEAAVLWKKRIKNTLGHCKIDFLFESNKSLRTSTSLCQHILILAIFFIKRKRFPLLWKQWTSPTSFCSSYCDVSCSCSMVNYGGLISSQFNWYVRSLLFLREKNTPKCSFFLCFSCLVSHPDKSVQSHGREGVSLYPLPRTSCSHAF